MRASFVSLKSKFVIFTSLTILAAVAMSLAVANYFAGNIIISQTLRLYGAETRLKAENLSAHFANIESDLNLLAHSPMLVQVALIHERMLLGDTSQIASFRSYESSFLATAEQIMSSKPEFLGIAFVGRKGNVITRHGMGSDFFKDKTRYLLSEDSLLRKAARSPAGTILVSRVHLSAENGIINLPYLPQMVYCACVHRGNEFLGAVFARINMESIFSTLSINSSGLQYIVDNEGYYLVHPDPQKKWGRELGSAVRLHTDLPSEKIASILRPIPGSVIYYDRFLVSAPVWPLRTKTDYYLTIIEEFDRYESLASYQVLSWVLIGFGGVILMAATYLSYIFAQSITEPIQKLRRALHELLEGKIPQRLPIRTLDEVGQLSHDANLLIDTSAQMADFAQRIGQGDFHYKPKFSAKLLLSNELVEMRDRIAAANDLKAKETWESMGINQVEAVLHLEVPIEELYQKVLEALAHYLHAEQGAIYVTTDDRLVLVAAYGLPYARVGEWILEEGENVAGQVWKEGKTIFITDIPADAEPIGSGLGKALPRCIVATALKAGNQSVGVVELGSLRIFEEFQIRFLEKVGQIIAVSFATALNNARNTRLMREAQQMAAQLQTQEEEARQTIEQLQSKILELQSQLEGRV